jgi:hypothetical protein
MLFQKFKQVLATKCSQKAIKKLKSLGQSLELKDFLTFFDPICH